jgi:hypothetical protein
MESCKCEGQITVSTIRIAPLLYLLTMGTQQYILQAKKINVSCKYGYLIAHQQAVHDFSFIDFRNTNKRLQVYMLTTHHVPIIYRKNVTQISKVT